MKTDDFWVKYQPGLRFATSDIGTHEFFEQVSAQRYALEPHIPEIVEFDRWSGLDVLEAGCGIGTDGARFAASGARYTGLDSSASGIFLASRRLALENLPGRFVASSVTQLPFPDATFDLVFSHGVIHHVDRTDAAVAEFHRVLRPGGTILVMVYHRDSLNYRFTIMLLRRALVGALLVPGTAALASLLTGEPRDVIAGHRTTLRKYGMRYLRDGDLFLSHNTDGPGNPLSKVYSRKEILTLFSRFGALRTEVRYLNLRLYPGGIPFSNSRIGQRLERRLGWHLYIEGRKEG